MAKSMADIRDERQTLEAKCHRLWRENIKAVSDAKPTKDSKYLTDLKTQVDDLLDELEQFERDSAGTPAWASSILTCYGRMNILSGIIKFRLDNNI